MVLSVFIYYIPYSLCSVADLYIPSRYLKHYEKWLPPQHYHMSEVKILLVQLIAKDQLELMVLSDEMLQLKLKYARDLIQLYETIAPCKAPNITLM